MGCTSLHVQDKDDEDVPANDAELESLHVKRHTLEKWVNEPFFQTTVIGCLVKVAYSGKYHLAEIVDVQEREPGKHRHASENLHAMFPGSQWRCALSCRPNLNELI